MNRSYIVCHMMASNDRRKGLTALSDGIPDMDRSP